MAGRQAAFLDRDGVINRDVGYVHEIARFELIDGVIKGLATLQTAGYVLVVVTNQSGIGRGYYGEAASLSLSRHLEQILATHGIVLAATYHCPHAPDLPGGCDCRKPLPGMIRTAARDLDIDVSASILIGDKLTDIQAGRAAGVGECFLLGAGQGSKGSEVHADRTFADLPTCADWVVARDRTRGQRTPAALS